MELSKVALEKSGDYHVQRAPAPHNIEILFRSLPSCPTKLQAVPEHRIICVLGLLKKSTFSGNYQQKDGKRAAVNP